MSPLIERGRFRGYLGRRVDLTKPIEITFWSSGEGQNLVHDARVICTDRQSEIGCTGVALFRVRDVVLETEQVAFFNPESGEAWEPLTGKDAIVRNVGR